MPCRACNSLSKEAVKWVITEARRMVTFFNWFFACDWMFR